MKTRVVLTVAAMLVVGAVGWLLLVVLPRSNRTANAGLATPGSLVLQPGARDEAGRRIRARLFYVGQDGMSLVGAEREVLYGDSTEEQARRILEAQLAPVVEPYVSPVPAGTRLRALFIKGDEAFVDLTGAVSSAHPGGTTAELLTVYAIVDALTVNLPAISSVQLLVDGQVVDSLAGHVDLRRALGTNTSFVH